jgi:hypothetical protein
MAIGEYLGNGNPDGSSFGSAITEKISFYGITPVVQAQIAAAGTDAATTQTLANDLRTKLIALGLVKA